MNAIKDQKTTQVIQNYILAGLLDKQQIASIFNVRSKKEFIEALYSEFSKEKQKEIWFHIINKKWNKDDEDVCFNEQECIMMKLIIENSGSIEKTECFKANVLGTNHKITHTAERLEILEYININLINNKTIYCLNLNIIKEVIK